MIDGVWMIGKLEPCPNCGYTRTEGDALVLESICPACGIVYARFNKTEVPEPDSSVCVVEHSSHTPRNLRGILLPAEATPISLERLAGYGLLYLLVLIWGWRFISSGISVEFIMGSMMHLINLPFHEFGHVLFSPFGRFMSILGGSLFQLLLPLCLLLVFLFKYRDPFAASITLWWFGQSFIDLSPYIADASFRSLPLIAGMGEDAHDWGNILRQLDWLQYDYSLAKASFFLGSIFIIISLIWGALILKKLYLSRD